ncbi:Alpha/Beta hydrolase protein [Cercophora samala]|uniref:Alpha/Beta hydrolase protein n=1 Tax=Cercophora samala TaxID=330535 RepID=A0AA40DAX1_9PEZI|nr:Alpha/Beta hydrolase protein [Cercophora samala]
MDTTAPPAPERRRAHDDEEDNNNNSDSTKTMTHQPPPLLSRITHLSKIYTAKSLSLPSVWLREWKEYFYPPPAQPDIVKTYECRPDLPVRIFFPSSYDLTSPHTLPTLFTIHGSLAPAPFVLGTPREDDEWNRSFADGQHTLIIALNYSKAPAAVFPAPLHDVEALLLAALADESLPVDRSWKNGKGRVGVLGFGGAGGNLAVGVVQLEGVVRKGGCKPGVVGSWGGWLDLAGDGGEGEEKEAWRWGYVPYGQDLRDGLVSPFYWAAGGEGLPEFKVFVAGEGDKLAGENRALATRLAGRGEENRGDVGGRGEGGKKKGLEKEDERFWFEEGGVKWVLVPGVGAGFEHREVREEMGWGEELVKDAEEKTELVMEELGAWLRRVWELDG